MSTEIKVTQWLNSREHQTDIDSVLTNIIRGAENSTSEAETALIFENEISYFYRTGVESTPFEVFKLIGVGKSKKKKHYRFKNKVLKASRYKIENVPLNGLDF